jgi:uncharacterized protein (DUF2141 family)
VQGGDKKIEGRQDRLGALCPFWRRVGYISRRVFALHRNPDAARPGGSYSEAIHSPETDMKAFLTACTAAVALLSFATITHAQGRCATVEVQNLHAGQGPLMLAAYSDAATFRKTAANQMQVPVTAETMQVQVCNLAGDTVALTLYQDLNSNGKLDANPFGMPTEPWGASGTVTPMSAPTWDGAHVTLGTSPIVVKLSK